MNSPGYAVVLILHMLSALFGFGALAATSWSAARAASAPDPYAVASLQRYFRPGTNLAPLALIGVPIFGVLLLFVGDSVDATKAYPWIGLALWVAVALLAAMVVWPQERAIQQLFAERGELALVRAAAHRCERAAAISVVLGLVALVVMLVQP
jgi:Predicted integral membrane protein (DUF2269)